MNQEEIKKILPHRDNMLLVEEAESVDENTAKGRYTIKGDEFFLKGHFPGNPGCAGSNALRNDGSGKLLFACRQGKKLHTVFHQDEQRKV